MKALDYVRNDLLWDNAIGRRNIAREKRALGREELRVTIEIDVLLPAETFHRFQEMAVAFVPQPEIAARRAIGVPGSAHMVEVIHFLERRHPKILVCIELMKQPRCSAFLSANTQEVRACIRVDHAAAFVLPAVVRPRFR